MSMKHFWVRSALTVLACLSIVSAAAACEWPERLYGYRPQNYGYPPSNYIFPRYGLVRGTVYFQGPPYGAPPPEAFGPPLPPPSMSDGLGAGPCAAAPFALPVAARLAAAARSESGKRFARDPLRRTTANRRYTAPSWPKNKSACVVVGNPRLPMFTPSAVNICGLLSV